MLVKVVVHPANLHDSLGAKLLLDGIQTQFPRLKVIWGDMAYQGKALGDWVKSHLNAELSIVQKAGVLPPAVGGKQKLPGAPSGFIVAIHRWIIERTFAWEGRNRRLAKDYECQPNSEEAICYIAMGRLMLRRLSVL